MNFLTRPNEAREEINRFVEKQTDGGIAAFLKEGLVTSETNMIFIEALSLQVSHLKYNKIHATNILCETGICAP